MKIQINTNEKWKKMWNILKVCKIGLFFIVIVIWKSAIFLKMDSNEGCSSVTHMYSGTLQLRFNVSK